MGARAVFLAAYTQPYYVYLGIPIRLGHVHDCKAAINHLLHRFGPELIRVLLAAHEHLCQSHQSWRLGAYKRLVGPKPRQASATRCPLKIFIVRDISPRRK